MRVIKLNKVTWVVYVVRIGEMRNAYKMLFPKSDGKITLEKHRRW
jgi:hypothetical protein